MKTLKTLKTLSTLFLILLLTSSCVSKRKINNMKNTIEQRKIVDKQLDTKISNLEDIMTNKNAIGELDDKSNVSIKNILDKEKNIIKFRTDSLNKMNEMLSSKKRVRIKDFKKIVSVITISNNDVSSVKTENIDFIDQLLKQKTFLKFNSAAFFSAGGYKIPEEKIEEAKNVFSPIVDSLLIFLKKYPNTKLNASIISSGYADGQGFGPGELVDHLTKNIGKDVASKEELNSELSKLRADEVSSILFEIYNNRTQSLTNLKNFQTQFFTLGKGEDFPNKKINDYQTNDERRRIVVIYWNALPE
jgi:hypothetical protein